MDGKRVAFEFKIIGVVKIFMKLRRCYTRLPRMNYLLFKKTKNVLKYGFLLMALSKSELVVQWQGIHNG